MQPWKFYPRSPCGERRCYSFRYSAQSWYFYPRSPCGERRGSQQLSGRPTKDFYPRSPCGERRFNPFKTLIILTFLSTLSLRRATPKLIINIRKIVDFYPRSPCGERQAMDKFSAKAKNISIHALLAESDCPAFNGPLMLREFLSTLSLRRATPGERHANSQQEFLSTLSLRRATKGACYNKGGLTFLSTLSLRRATLVVIVCFLILVISIHALLAESDYTMTIIICTAWRFLSTLSLRRATIITGAGNSAIRISIHALLAESDLFSLLRNLLHNNFYPRSPCGERQSLWPSH